MVSPLAWMTLADLVLRLPTHEQDEETTAIVAVVVVVVAVGGRVSNQ